MTQSQFSMLILVLFLALSALALTLISVLTDYWYIVEAGTTVNNTSQPYWTYNYGLWRKCYDDIPQDMHRKGNCVSIYQDLIKEDEGSASHDDQLYMHLSRAVVGCAIAMGAAILAGVLSLICGVWPADCKQTRRSKLYFITSLILLFASMCGFASGISFITIRDMDKHDRNAYPEGVHVQYGWSFMVTWIASGISLIDSFILLCMLRNTYDDINAIQKYSYYNMRD